MTRPDLSYVVSKLSRYTNNPDPSHQTAVQRVVKYLANTKDIGLRFGPKEGSAGELIGYSDASHSDDIDTSRSTGAYVFKFFNGPISWRSKLQPVITMSALRPSI